MRMGVFCVHKPGFLMPGHISQTFSLLCPNYAPEFRGK